MLFSGRELNQITGQWFLFLLLVLFKMLNQKLKKLLNVANLLVQLGILFFKFIVVDLLAVEEQVRTMFAWLGFGPILVLSKARIA
jgi:hypothetical protein